MGSKSTKWIHPEEFAEIEPGDRLEIRFMNGIQTVEEHLGDELLVSFKGGAWDGKTIRIVRHQISKLLL